MDLALLLALFIGIATPALLQVGAIEVFTTTTEMKVVNGTDVRLECTFKSNKPVSAATVSASWNFRPLGQMNEESVFYYLHETGYPPEVGRFKGRAVWSGDVLSRDVSITLQDVRFSDNGTYICQVHNRPDVHGPAGEIHLRVVQSASFSEIGVLAATVGGAIGVVLFILVVFVIIRLCRRRKSEMEYELPERKDPSML